MVLGFGWGWVGTQVFMDGKGSWDVSRLCHGIRCVDFQGLGRGIRGLGGLLVHDAQQQRAEFMVRASGHDEVRG